MKKPKFKKPDLKKIKDKMDTIGLKRYKLDNEFDDVEFNFDRPSTPKKTKQNLLAKTKELLKDYKTFDEEEEELILTSFDEEEYILLDGDLSDLQSDLAMMSADIKHEEEKKSQWESITTIKSIEKRRLKEYYEFEEDYWVVEFVSLISLYLKSMDFNKLIKTLEFPKSLSKPVLARLFEKLKSSERVFLLID